MLWGSVYPRTSAGGRIPKLPRRHFLEVWGYTGQLSHLIGAKEIRTLVRKAIATQISHRSVVAFLDRCVRDPSDMAQDDIVCTVIAKKCDGILSSVPGLSFAFSHSG